MVSDIARLAPLMMTALKSFELPCLSLAALALAMLPAPEGAASHRINIDSAQSQTLPYTKIVVISAIPVTPARRTTMSSLVVLLSGLLPVATT